MPETQTPEEVSKIGEAHSAVYREADHLNEKLAALPPEDKSARVATMRTSLKNVVLNADTMEEDEVVRQYAKLETEKARLE